MKVNLHTHTARCYHAQGEDEVFVQAAIAAGYQKLGFADHTPFPYTDGFHNHDKMEIDKMEGYVQSVLSLKEQYKDQIEIYLGLECEVVPEFFGFLRQCRERMDYLILGNHGDKRIEPYFGRITTAKEMEHYTDMAIQGMETGLFLYLCHPDLMFNSATEFTDAGASLSREICRAANRLHIPLEYNMLGVSRPKQPGCLGYPVPQFWEIAAQENVTAVIGVDAHMPEHFARADLDGAKALLRSMGVPVLDDPTLLLPK